MSVKYETNWDYYYNKTHRKLLSLLGLTGNLFLNREIGKYIVQNANNLGSFIEIGAGSGYLSKLMSEKFRECFILDRSKFALEISSKRAKKAHSILCDVFEFNKKEEFDVVVSLGLVEHFNEKEMQNLISIHIEIAKKDGCVFILVPAHYKKREEVVGLPSMIRKFGFQDAFAEYKIEDYLKKNNIQHIKKYLDFIPHYTWYYEILRKIVLFPYLLFGWNLEFIVHKEKGSHVVFFINKKK